MMTTFLIYDCLSTNSFLTQQYTRRYPTWEADDAEGRAEEEDRVADVVEVEVLDAACAEDDEEDDEDGAMEAVVDVSQRWGLHLHEADSGEGSGEDDEECNSLADGSMLNPEDVSAKQPL